MIVNVVLVALSVALLGVAFAVRADDDDDEGQRASLPRGAGARATASAAAARDDDPPAQSGRPLQKATCREQSHTVENPTRWFHPTDNFYPPGKQALARADLDHLAS